MSWIPDKTYRFFRNAFEEQKSFLRRQETGIQIRIKINDLRS
jgi:hypothetical protein